MTLKELHDVAKREMQYLTTVPQPDFRLEEAEYDKEKQVWNTVVSFLVENTNKRMTPIGTFTTDFQYHRIYKKVKINDHRDLVGMYIYNE